MSFAPTISREITAIDDTLEGELLIENLSTAEHQIAGTVLTAQSISPGRGGLRPADGGLAGRQMRLHTAVCQIPA